MTPQRTLVVLAWLVSVAAAYYFGVSSDAAKDDLSPEEKASANAQGKRAGIRQGAEFAASTGDENLDVPMLIAYARAQIVSGWNSIEYLRAMAPIASLTDAQVQAALAEVERAVREPEQKTALYCLLLGRWAESDGPAALAYAEEKLGPDRESDHGVRASILDVWARRDPEAAWRWFQNEAASSGNDRIPAGWTGAVFRGMALHDLDTALQRADLLDETKRIAALNVIATSPGSETARRRLLELARTLPPAKREPVQKMAMTQWTIYNREAAVAWMRTLPVAEQGPLRDAAGSALLSIQPAAGAELLLEGAQEAGKPKIYERIAGSWAYKDPRAAAEWLERLPQGPELDSARRSYVFTVLLKDPATAMVWAAKIQNQQQRENAIRNVFSQWRVKDAPAAEAALRASGFPAEKSKELLNSAPR